MKNIDLDKMCQGEITELEERHGVSIVPRIGFFKSGAEQFWSIDNPNKKVDGFAGGFETIFAGNQKEVELFLMMCEEKSLEDAIQHFCEEKAFDTHEVQEQSQGEITDIYEQNISAPKKKRAR